MQNERANKDLMMVTMVSKRPQGCHLFRQAEVEVPLKSTFRGIWVCVTGRVSPNLEGAGPSVIPIHSISAPDFPSSHLPSFLTSKQTNDTTTTTIKMPRGGETFKRPKDAKPFNKDVCTTTTTTRPSFYLIRALTYE